MKRVNIHLPEEMIGKYNKLSDKKGVSRAEYIRRVFDKHIEECDRNE